MVLAIGDAELEEDAAPGCPDFEAFGARWEASLK